jgi:hypothetical protein
MKIPSLVGSVIGALRFTRPDRSGLRDLNEAQWEECLSLCDRMHLTIPLRQNCEDNLPIWVRSRIDQNIVGNKERFERLKNVYLEIAKELRGVGAEHLVLKGFANSPDFVKDPSLRMQGDLDLFCPPDSIFPARDALAKLGYEVIHGLEHQPTDHLPAMMRKTPWQWQGNYFDPEIPVGVDLHFRFWNDATTRLNLKGLDQFWIRRVERNAAFTFPSLSAVDGLGYAALHVFHHLQMGELAPYHVYELGSFLEANADSEQFWTEWEGLHDGSLRRVEAVSFRLASDWFACRISEKVMREINNLPPAVQRWFHQYADSPLRSLVRPNKDALWLHLGLLESARDKRMVFFNSLFPARVPPIQAVRQWSLRTYRKFLPYAISRLVYHLCKVPETLWEGFRWWASGSLVKPRQDQTQVRRHSLLRFRTGTGRRRPRN